MGSRFNKSIVSQEVKRSLIRWQQRARSSQNSSTRLLSTRSTSSTDFLWESIHRISRSRRRGNSSARVDVDSTLSYQAKDVPPDKRSFKSLEELLEKDQPSMIPSSGTFTSYEDYDHQASSSRVKDDSCLLLRTWHGYVAVWWSKDNQVLKLSNSSDVNHALPVSESENIWRCIFQIDPMELHLCSVGSNGDRKQSG